MYRRNHPTPVPIAMGAIYLKADGAIQTADVLARVRPAGGSWGAAANSPTVDATSGIWSYTPSQPETDHESLEVALFKADCTSLATTILFGTPVTEPLDVNLTNDQVDELVAAILAAAPGVTGAVDDETATDTGFETDLTNENNDFYKDAYLLFTSGALRGQSRLISAYNGTSKAITVAKAFTSAPANGDEFIILGRSE